MEIVFSEVLCSHIWQGSKDDSFFVFVFFFGKKNLYSECLVLLHFQEHILETKDEVEVDRIKANVEECRKTLQNLGYADFTFEDFFAVTALLLNWIVTGNFIIGIDP